MRGLYAILDVASVERRGLDPVALAEAILDAPIAAMQLRDKRVAGGPALSLLRQLRVLTRRCGVPLYANDRADLALLAECDGVHLGQNDIPVATARRLGVPEIGLSVHNATQLAAAQEQAPDYIAFGPVFATQSKANPDPVLGRVGLDALVARAGDMRVVAIGGITRQRMADVARACPCAAVIGALLPSTDAAHPYLETAERSQALCNALRS